ncbi:MAG: hypothetical protein ASARMPREDX12_007669 [Alectoria sarmentosa]|nr:MAG: hypothetical protein ASARMPREDX12_007669 [Alectoria sarmentosa]
MELARFAKPAGPANAASVGTSADLAEISNNARLIHLGELCFKQKVSASNLFKVSCALLNNHLTLSREVLLTTTQAGRKWPYLHPLFAQHLPNPVTIAGNTLAVVLDRMEIHPEETVGSYLVYLEEEQQLLMVHAHAWISSITMQLNPDDAAAFLAGRRQLLNWNPSLAKTVNENGEKMRIVQLLGYTEVMLEWRCGMLQADVVSVHV